MPPLGQLFSQVGLSVVPLWAPPLVSSLHWYHKIHLIKAIAKFACNGGGVSAVFILVCGVKGSDAQIELNGFNKQKIQCWCG